MMAVIKDVPTNITSTVLRKDPKPPITDSPASTDLLR